MPVRHVLINRSKSTLIFSPTLKLYYKSIISNTSNRCFVLFFSSECNTEVFFTLSNPDSVHCTSFTTSVDSIVQFFTHTVAEEANPFSGIYLLDTLHFFRVVIQYFNAFSYCILILKNGFAFF